MVVVVGGVNGSGGKVESNRNFKSDRSVVRDWIREWVMLECSLLLLLVVL